MARVNRKRRTRREFLTESAALVAGTSVAACFPDVGGKWPGPRNECQTLPESSSPLMVSPDVIEVSDEASVQLDTQTFKATLQPTVVETMVEQALVELTGGVAQPWHQIFPDYTPQLRIGIKVNCLNSQCPTSVPVVRALVDHLRAELGVDAEQLVVWDRRGDELLNCGFTDETMGVPTFGTVTSTTDTSGPGYELDHCEIVRGKQTRLSRILTELTDVTINCPVLKSHGISGVTGAMKNVYGVINNPADFHADLNDTLPLIYNLVPIRSRMRLSFLDALVAVTTGDTSSPMDTVARRVITSRDALALDRYALDLVNQLRAEKNVGLRDIGETTTRWLNNAGQMGIGTLEYQLTARVLG